MTRNNDYDLTRCRQAWEMYDSQMTYKEIADILGVARNRARIMVNTWKQHQLEQDAQADLAEWRKE